VNEEKSVLCSFFLLFSNPPLAEKTSVERQTWNTSHLMLGADLLHELKWGGFFSFSGLDEARADFEMMKDYYTDG
jgi:hypothetical protein